MMIKEKINEVIRGLKKDNNWILAVVYAVSATVEGIFTYKLFNKYVDEINELDTDDETFEHEVARRNTKLTVLGIMGVLNAVLGSLVFIKLFKDLKK